MKTKKPIIFAVVAIFVSLLLFAACGNEGADPTDETDQNQLTAEIIEEALADIQGRWSFTNENRVLICTINPTGGSTMLSAYVITFNEDNFTIVTRFTTSSNQDFGDPDFGVEIIYNNEAMRFLPGRGLLEVPQGMEPVSWGSVGSEPFPIYEIEITGTVSVTAADEILLTSDDDETWTFGFARDGRNLDLRTSGHIFHFSR